MRDRPEAAMIFAAGLGTRMGKLTAERPKPMIEVAGRRLIDHALAPVREMDLARIVVNLHYMPEPLAEHLAGTGVLLSRESPDILETGGGLRAALPLLGPGPVYTMNSDAVWKGPNPLRVLLERWDPSAADALLLCIPKDRAAGHGADGDFLSDESGRARRGPGMVYSGLQIIKPDGLAEIEGRAFSLNVLWDRMLERGRLHAIEYPGQWCDVGMPEGIVAAERMLGARGFA